MTLDSHFEAPAHHGQCDPRIEQLRVPPQSVEAEQAVLGGLMISENGWARVCGLLSADDFYRRDHQLIWRAIEELAEKQKPYDAVTMGEWFESMGQAEQVAGGAYLFELASTTPSAANIVAYAEIVAGKALQRRLIEVGTEIVNDGFQPDGKDVIDLLAEAQHRIVALQPKQRGGLQFGADSLNEWFDDLQRRYQAEDRMTGLPTPWKEVNDATHGLQGGELTLIAARPSMGKSIMGQNLALMNALRGKRVAMFSLEMNRNQIHRRNIASLMQVSHDWLLAPHDGEDYWPRVTEAIRTLRKANLYIDDTADLTIRQVMARARNLQFKEKIDLIVVDHIHDFKINAKEARFEYGGIAQGLKTLAKEFDIPVAGLAQLNRNVGNRADKRPTMTDLRESGELEQKGDLILFLHREDYYDKNTHLQGVVEVILAKGRDIEAGKTLYLKNDYAHMALRDWEGPLPEASRALPRGSRIGFGE
jgi:replicative DNA helicase